MAREGKKLFKNDEIEVVQYGDEIHINDLKGPPMSDSVLIFKEKTFWDMVTHIKVGRNDF